MRGHKKKQINDQNRQRNWRGGRGEEEGRREEENVFMKPKKSRRSADAKRRIIIFFSPLNFLFSSPSSASFLLHITVRWSLCSRFFLSCRLPCCSLQSIHLYSSPFLSLSLSPSDVRVRSSSCCLTSISVGCSPPSFLSVCHSTDWNDRNF